jgi:ABC-type transport system substrate-binding protein
VIDELIVHIGNSDNIRIKSSQKGEKMKKKLFWGLLVVVLVVVPLLAACGEEAVTTTTKTTTPPPTTPPTTTPPPATANFLYDPGWPGNPEVAIDLTNSFFWGKDNTLFKDTEINDLINQVLTTIDDDARYELAKQAWAKINDLLPEIPIGLEVQTNMMKTNITYTKSVGGAMTAGPMQLVDLTISPKKTTSINIAYPGGFMGGLTSVDPCDFANGGPPNPNVFESLVGFDGNEQMIGLLADTWSWSEDGLTLTVNLRHDVKFSSGDPFTAADVEFSLARHAEKDMPVIAQLSPEQGYSGMEVVDDNTVKFLFTKVNVQFVPQTLVNMGITSKTYYDRVGEDAYIAMPVGTGPYKIVSWAEGQYIDLAYNENYRGAKPQILTAHLVAAADNSTRVAMLQAGEVDMANQVPGASITALEEAGFTAVYVPQPHDLVLQLDLLTPDTPWQDIRVRQAIDYAIDKKSIKDSMICGPIQEGVWALSTAPWYDPSLKPAYDYDLAKAQELMAAAGYADGFTLPITYLATETVTPLADYLASALAAINITVELTALSGMPEFMPSIAAIHNYYAALSS